MLFRSKPGERPATARAFAEELRGWLGEGPVRTGRPVGVRLLDGPLQAALDTARSREVGRAGWEELRIGVLAWVERELEILGETGTVPARAGLLAAQAELLLDLAEGSTKGTRREASWHIYLADAVTAAEAAMDGLEGEARAWNEMVLGAALREQTTGDLTEQAARAREHLDAALSGLPEGSAEWARVAGERAKVEVDEDANEGAAGLAERAAGTFASLGEPQWEAWAW